MKIPAALERWVARGYSLVRIADRPTTDVSGWGLLYIDKLTRKVRVYDPSGGDRALEGAGGGGGAPSGSAGGDLGGSYPNPTVTQARGLKSATTTVSVSAATAPTSGQVLMATSSTAATWQTSTDRASVLSAIAIGGVL